MCRTDCPPDLTKQILLEASLTLEHSSPVKGILQRSGALQSQGKHIGAGSVAIEHALAEHKSHWHILARRLQTRPWQATNLTGCPGREKPINCLAEQAYHCASWQVSTYLHPSRAVKNGVTGACRAVAGAAPDDQMQRLAARIALHTHAMDSTAQMVAAVRVCLVRPPPVPFGMPSSWQISDTRYEQGSYHLATHSCSPCLETQDHLMHLLGNIPWIRISCL